MSSGSSLARKRDRGRGLESYAAVGMAILAGLLLAGAPFAAAAASRHAAMTIDANTGQVLHDQGGDELRYPASLTKMMTLYIVFELLEQGRLQPNSRIRISPNAASTSPSKLGLEAGAEITVMNAVQALIVKSANDIAVAVAEHIAGSEAKFASLMTQKARQLGMTKTTFRNAHGLPDSGQLTTARDMLTLALRLNDDFPRQYHLFAARSFAYGAAVHRNHNTMLTTYRGMDGLKTGYTGPSGFNLVASVRRDGKHVVAAVFGGSSAAARNAYMRVMLDRTLPKAATTRTRQPALVARATKGDAPIQRNAQPRLVEPIKLAEPQQQQGSPPVGTKRSPPTSARIAAAPPAPAAARALQPIALEPAAEPPLPPSAAPGAPVDITRVRPVVVAPRPRRSVEPASAALPPPPTDPLAMAEPAARGAQPSSLQAQAQRLQRGEPPTPAKIAPAPPMAKPQTAPATVAAGTLPSYRLNGPGSPSAAAPVMIQIGAYSSEAEALRQLQTAKARAAEALAAAKPLAMPTTAGGRQLFRARFSGFDPASASAACLELRRQQIDCHVTNGS